jgi:hypothetical protein
MDEIEKSRIGEIIKLHNEITGYLKMSLKKAIKIGEMLLEQKKTIGHGRFILWVDKNLPFSDRTARRYISIYKYRSRLKSDNVSNLSDAYKLISGPKSEYESMIKAIENYDKLSQSGKEDVNEDVMNLSFKTFPDLTIGDEKLPDNWNPDESIKKINNLMDKLRTGVKESLKNNEVRNEKVQCQRQGPG